MELPCAGHELVADTEDASADRYTPKKSGTVSIETR